jgi:hypothetical protein
VAAVSERAIVPAIYVGDDLCLGFVRTAVSLWLRVRGVGYSVLAHRHPPADHVLKEAAEGPRSAAIEVPRRSSSR